MTAVASPPQSFDQLSARELYLYLVAPFEDLLSDVKALMIVPQGPIVGLPFEALVDTGSGGFLIDRWAVSYAPNATMALTALSPGVAHHQTRHSDSRRRYRRFHL